MMGQPFGRYELLKRLAAGGMGEVHLARQVGVEGFEKLLVVKVLLPHLVEDEEFIQMFFDEARVAARLNHSNIAQIYDMGEVDGANFIAMEYIHGEDVVRLWKAARKAEKRVPMELAARIAADAAAGLDYAHKATDANHQPLNLVHRDVSPQNILVTFDGGVKIIDFGVAKAAGSRSQTATGILKGKYAYMSPEQAAGLPIDHRSDIFALGVVLYEMLTSLRLFKRDTELQTLRAVSDCQVDPPSRHNPEIDPGLDAIVLKALAPNRDDRFEDAQALRLALEDWMVQSRKSGSAAHLSAFMRTLYSERLGKERAEGRPFTDDGTPSVSRSSVGRSRAGGLSTSVARPVSRVAPQPQTTTQHTDLIQNGGAPRGPSVAVKLGALLGAVVLLGLGALLLLRPDPAPQPQVAMLNLVTRPSGAQVLLNAEDVGTTPLMGYPLQSGKPSQLEVRLEGFRPVKRALSGAGVENVDLALEPAAPPAKVVLEPVVMGEQARPEAAGEVNLQLVSTPAGARVTLDGQVLGETPLAFRHARGEAVLDFQFTRPGYRPAVRSVSAGEDAEVKAVLVKAAGRSPRPDPLDIKTGR